MNNVKDKISTILKGPTYALIILLTLILLEKFEYAFGGKIQTLFLNPPRAIE